MGDLAEGVQFLHVSSSQLAPVVMKAGDQVASSGEVDLSDLMAALKEVQK
jgi:hypothetical protein